jgi:asparagine synthase (glutamine-hydrolysing)
MCGIAGQFTMSENLSVAKAETMSSALAHRGPDGDGLFVNEKRSVALIHRRLSIIDLSDNARQPMSTRDGRFTLVFNGEIFNHAELRRSLALQSTEFKSQGDTEVLLNLWAKEGESCLRKLRGMFAFAVWDEQFETLTLARDPFGIKPLYYSQGASFCFASEIRALRAIGLGKEASPEGIGAFLQWGSIPAPLTLRQGISALPAGHVLSVSRSRGNQGPRKYWSFTQEIFAAQRKRGTALNISREQAVAEVRAALLDSTRKHLVSDVPVGAFLSGGIDSTAVVSLMRQAGQEEIATFSLGMGESPLDETAFAQIAADTYGTRHHTLTLSKQDFLAHRNAFMDSMDSPSIDGINTWFVAKFAHDLGYKVVTSGAGGDEFFHGYDSTFELLPKIMRLTAKFPESLLRAISRIAQPAKGLAPDAIQKALDILRMPGNLAHAYHCTRSLYPSNRIPGLLKDKALGKLAEATSMTARLNETTDAITGERLTLEDAIMVHEVSRYLGSQLLTDADTFSMFHSLELRVPLVDVELTQVLLGVGTTHLHADNNPYKKALMVEAVGDIPDSIVHRKKQGFILPMRAWLQSFEWRPKSGWLSEAECQRSAYAFSKGKLHWTRYWALQVLDHHLAS